MASAAAVALAKAAGGAAASHAAGAVSTALSDTTSDSNLQLVIVVTNSTQSLLLDEARHDLRSGSSTQVWPFQVGHQCTERFMFKKSKKGLGYLDGSVSFSLKRSDLLQPEGKLQLSFRKEIMGTSAMGVLVVMTDGDDNSIAIDLQNIHHNGSAHDDFAIFGKTYSLQTTASQKYWLVDVLERFQTQSSSSHSLSTASSSTSPLPSTSEGESSPQNSWPSYFFQETGKSKRALIETETKLAEEVSKNGILRQELEQAKHDQVKARQEATQARSEKQRAEEQMQSLRAQSRDPRIARALSQVREGMVGFQVLGERYQSLPEEEQTNFDGFFEEEGATQDPAGTPEDTAGMSALVQSWAQRGTLVDDVMASLERNRSKSQDEAERDRIRFCNSNRRIERACLRAQNAPQSQARALLLSWQEYMIRFNEGLAELVFQRHTGLAVALVGEAGVLLFAIFGPHTFPAVMVVSSVAAVFAGVGMVSEVRQCRQRRRPADHAAIEGPSDQLNAQSRME